MRSILWPNTVSGRRDFTCLVLVARSHAQLLVSRQRPLERLAQPHRMAWVGCRSRASLEHKRRRNPTRWRSCLSRPWLSTRAAVYPKTAARDCPAPGRDLRLMGQTNPLAALAPIRRRPGCAGLVVSLTLPRRQRPPADIRFKSGIAWRSGARDPRRR